MIGWRDKKRAFAANALCVVVLALAATAACGRPDSAEPSSKSAARLTSGTVPVQAVAIEPAQEQVTWSGQGCTRSGCHLHIEPIRQLDSGMMKAIRKKGAAAGDPDGCVVCHGGTPGGATAKEAHASTVASLRDAGGPDDFFADPGSPWVNARSCGQCHATQVETQWTSLMMTESGKIQGTAWDFGSLEGYDHKWGNYDVHNLPKRVGTDDYRQYMDAKARAFPNVFEPSLSTVPRAPGDPLGGLSLDELSSHPEQAAFTYIRNQCERCHLGVKGRSARGDYRGMGCSACHMPYGVEGFYEGHDETIPRDTPGHPLVHSIQGTRTTRLSIHGTTYTGVPVETCAACHDRGKRIGVSYQGLMENAFDSPFTEGGGGQVALHSKSYIAMASDVHYQKGMFCQDCHTSGDLHGDGTLAGTNLGGVEIECTDCHGTPTKFPWELPLGWGDENGPGPATGPPRGVAHAIPEYLKQGYVADAPQGWLRTARGNPMPHVTRDGDDVIVHTAGGADLRLATLKAKLAHDRLSVEARTAMVNVPAHVDKMECYSCHTAWAPQCYGCHVKVDFSDAKKSVIDWVAAGHEHMTAEHRTARGEEAFAPRIPGQTTETRSYMRWEDPVLGINGEGRVSPLVPGCQVSVTVIGKDGKDVVLNHIFRTAPGTEGSGPEGQLGSDMSPTTPHTVGKSRSCESCHGSAKTMGYGIGGGTMAAPMASGAVVDLVAQNGKVLSSHARFQIEPIAGLRDWSQVVTPDGKQTQTVGHHFAGSGPLPADVRAKMDRRNVCLGCHQSIPQGDLAVSVLHHIAEHAGKLPVTNAEHRSLLSKIACSSAWAQVLALAGTPLAVLGGFVVFVRRRRGLER